MRFGRSLSFVSAIGRAFAPFAAFLPVLCLVRVTVLAVQVRDAARERAGACGSG